MAKTTMSNWRLQARQVIEQTLAGLPAEMPLDQKRRAVQRAYPFGPRQHHPYKCWLIEVKLAFHVQEQREPMSVCFRFSPIFWLSVSCTFCNHPKAPTLKGGCLLCQDFNTRLERVVHRPEWRGFRLSLVAKDVGARQVVSDWLEEHGLPEAAELLRKETKG